MLNRNQFALSVNKRFFYGWVMLGVGFAGLFASGPGQSFIFSIFLRPLVEELDLTHTAISLAYAVGTMTASLLLPFVGRLVDKHGPRKMIVLISFMLGTTCLLFPLVMNVIALYFAFTAVRFFGQGSLMLASNNLVAQWFSRRRGIALSIISLGFALGTAVYPPVVQWSIDTIGWRASWLWLGGLVWLLMIPATWLLVVNRPEDIGMKPDGDGGPSGDTVAPVQSPAASDELPLEHSWTRKEAMSTWTFWILAIGLANPSAFITAVIFFQIDYFKLQGLTEQMAANIFPITGVSMAVFMLLFGTLLDRFKTRMVASTAIFLMATTMWMLLFADTWPLAVVYAIVLGACQGSMMASFAYVWPRYFGRKHLGSIQGPASTVIIIGASLGPLPFGIAKDWLGGYHEAFLLFSLLPLVFSILVFNLKPLGPPPRVLAETKED